MTSLSTRLAFATLLLAAFSLPARAQAPAPSAGCGNPATHFDVDTDRGLHPAPQAPGRALVFFAQDDSNVAGFHKPIVRVGIDGKWVGATHGTSYFFFYVEPGEHHLCSDWQDMGFFSHKTQLSGALNFTAQAGGVYYFQITNTFRGAARTSAVLAPVTPSNPEDYLADYDFAFFHQLP